MDVIRRLARHVRLTGRAYSEDAGPAFLVLFVNSICNMKCEHCFYWRNLNRRDDLTFEEIRALSGSLGAIENLYLSGGEPFLRRELAAICRTFVSTNGVRQIYVPTNGYYTQKTVAAVLDVLQEPELDLLVVELSLDGTSEFHDRFRVSQGSFDKAMATYDALADIQTRDPRLRIHAISTATDVNMDEIARLTTYLFERCPRMDHHNLALIRGDRKNPALSTPPVSEYEALYEYIRRLWAPREQGRYGSVVEPMLQWAKVETLKQQRQVVPCRAGRLNGVVYANGDVSVCELHEPIGNLRTKGFPETWASEAARALRRSIRRGECHCTTEVFLWSSIVYQPLPLAQALVRGKVWLRPEPLPEAERVRSGTSLNGLKR